MASRKSLRLYCLSLNHSNSTEIHLLFFRGGALPWRIPASQPCLIWWMVVFSARHINSSLTNNVALPFHPARLVKLTSPKHFIFFEVWWMYRTLLKSTERIHWFFFFDTAQPWFLACCTTCGKKVVGFRGSHIKQIIMVLAMLITVFAWSDVALEWSE